MKEEIKHFLDECFTEINLSDYNLLSNDGLFSGKSGLIYFYYVLYQANKNEDYLEEIENILTLIIDKLEDNSSSILLNNTIYDGLSGFGFVIKKLIDSQILSEDYISILDSINDVIYQDCIYHIGQNNFDFMNGSIGMLHYLLALNDEKYSKVPIDMLYDRIKDKNMPFYNDAVYLEGIHIGYAHGICGIIKVLDKVGHLEKVKYINNFLVNHLNDILKKDPQVINGSTYFLPRSIHSDSAGFNMNWRPILSWANSDLNFSTLITSLENLEIKDNYNEIALRIAKESTTRKDKDQTSITDYRLYYGTAGVAQMYKKLYAKYHDLELEKAYEYWILKTFNLMKNNRISKTNFLEFLNNYLGAILVLSEFIDPEIEGWDDIILL